MAWSDLTGLPISLELAEQALEDLLPQAEAEIPPQLILEETARYYSLSVEEIVSKSRSRPLTTARHVAMYLVRECTGMSLIKIGEFFDRDHSTALHGINKIDEQMRDRGEWRTSVPADPVPAPLSPVRPHVGQGRYACRTRVICTFPQALLLLKEISRWIRSSKEVDNREVPV